LILGDRAASGSERIARLNSTDGEIIGTIGPSYQDCRTDRAIRQAIIDVKVYSVST
jgi:hypothetical protein